MDNKQYANFSSIKGIKEKKRFESYIGWSFSREFKCEKYYQSVNYSLKKEKDLIIYLLGKNNIEIYKRKQIIINLDKYVENLNALKSLDRSDNKLSQSESKSDKNKKTNSDNSNIYINIIENKKNKDKNKKKFNKKELKELKSKIVDDIYGYIDVIIPNVQKINFLNMLNKKFYHNDDYKYINFKEEDLKNLPDTFHLLIETGLNMLYSEMPHKIKQIKKYISLINIRNNINDDMIKKLYIDDFAKRFSLNINLAKGKNISNKFVYMLISNSDYGSFIHRFFDNKPYKNEKNDEFDNISKNYPDESIFYGFVDFAKSINSISFLDKKITEQNKILEENKKELDSIKRSLHNIRVLYIPIIILLTCCYIFSFIYFINGTNHLTQYNN